MISYYWVTINLTNFSIADLAYHLRKWVIMLKNVESHYVKINTIIPTGYE